MAYQIWTASCRKYGAPHATLKDAVAHLGGQLISGTTYRAAGYLYDIKPAVAETTTSTPAAAAKTYVTGTSFGQEDADEIYLNGARRRKWSR